jgi:hypothetical protein
MDACMPHTEPPGTVLGMPVRTGPDTSLKPQQTPEQACCMLKWQAQAPCTTLSCQPARQSSAPRPSTSSCLINASCAHANRTPPLLPLLSSLPLLLPPLLMPGASEGCAPAARSPAVTRLLHPWPRPLSSTTALRMPLGQLGTTYTYLQDSISHS